MPGSAASFILEFVVSAYSQLGSVFGNWFLYFIQYVYMLRTIFTVLLETNTSQLLLKKFYFNKILIS